ITDANVVTGVLDPKQFLGGKMKLDKTKAERTLEEKIARPLSLSLLEAADGILKVINVKMEEAIKAVSSQRGYDIRDFTLVAFGGGGPMHAGRMAFDLGIPSVLVPLTPGVHSALGLLMSDVKHDYVRSKLVGLDELDLNEINNLFAQLIERAKADLNAEGFQDREIKIEPFLDLRYAGQGYELTVPCPMPPLKPEDLKLMRQRFDTQHEQASGHKAETEPVELVSLRLISYGLVPQAKLFVMTVDPVTLQVIRARLAGIVQEMQNSLFRTGYSTIIRESQDASCAILNTQGEVVAQHVVLPLHMGAFPACAAGVLKNYT